jgi:hypothetical protein
MASSPKQPVAPWKKPSAKSNLFSSSVGITLFAVIDHSGEAEAIGMKMPDTKLVIFGNSKGGTLCFKGLLFQTRTYVALLVAAPVFCQCIPIATSDSSIISEMIPHEITQ